MNQTTARFDLLDEPWIRAINVDGRARELSLRGVFAHAHELAGLTGELPTQSFAVLRLLLAVLLRACDDRSRPPVQVWGELWRAGGETRKLPVETIDEYLLGYRHRFDLLDPVEPFMQVAALRSENNAVSGLDKMIADVPNGDKYFTNRGGAWLERISFAEAARWLVHTHAFDSSGIKTGAVDDPRAKKGKGYPIGVAWSGCLGGVFVEGATVAETLLLNLVLRDGNGARWDGDDQPVWERDPDSGRQRLDAIPAGPADLFTWQSRRIRLVHDDHQVTGVVLCNGDALEPFNRQRIEPMTGWRFSTVQSRKAGHPRHYPIQHDPDRTLWRGLTPMLAELASPGSQEGRPVAPGVMEWVRFLVDDEELDSTYPLRLHATGMHYINNQSVIGDVIDDALGFRAGLLATDPALRLCVLRAVQIADDAVAALDNLAGNLARVQGGDPAGARHRAREQGFAGLDAPFRQWLSQLSPGGDVPSYEVEWQMSVCAVIEAAASRVIAAAGPKAWTGRVIDGKHVDAGLAEIWFRRRMRTTVPAAYPRQPESTAQNEDAAA